ncbi:2'-5' RNA ligase family protein [Sphingomonas sp. RG327]|uniref:2'-5' RNA ligase family protein n=1 Tax=Sphingomonas anseongensis TaxID=2908207 RepID=A0ABT0RD65_9SPHN|nr:2'-5' RNA ligase family protein [Sphingomonas anseongensis]MCL6678188.1 2'-5' RNA ligase family protein [Sphingomonas anseongensis]
MAGALIILAELGKSDFAWLDALRRRHYPPERNRVPAHLTLFRALPPSVEGEVRRSLARAGSEPAPQAVISGAMDLDSGVALRVHSPELEAIRDQLAADFHGLLTSQDSGPWTAHITIQNKVDPKLARTLLKQLREGFEPRPIAIAGLRLVRYVDGKWEDVAAWKFR